MPQRLEDSKIHKDNFQPVPEQLERIGKLIVDSAYSVHYNLGPGLLEKVYLINFSVPKIKEGIRRFVY